MNDPVTAEYKRLKAQVKKINDASNLVITKAYVEYRDIQAKAKLDAKAKILLLDVEFAKIKKENK